MEIRPRAQQYLPPVVKNLLIINGLFYVATIVLYKSQGILLTEYLAMYYFESPNFKIWQVVTHMFMHATFSPTGAIVFSHIFFNMFALWMFGSILEQRFGAKRFLQFYILCGLGAAICHQLVQYIDYSSGNLYVLGIPTVGASGAVYGLLFAFGYLFPNALLYLFFAVPIKAKYVVAGLALIGLFAGLSNNPGDNVAHFAHLGGMLAGFIVFKVWGIRYNQG